MFENAEALARAAWERLEAGSGRHDVYILGGSVGWEDLPELVWEADALGMELVLGHSRFNGGCFVFRFRAKEG